MKDFALIYNYDTLYRYRDVRIIVIKINIRRIYMNKHKKFWWLLLPSCLIIFTLLWRSTENNQQNKVQKIGILQLVEHEALDAARKGFIEGLKELGFEGKINCKNAGDDLSTCTLIANQFVSENCDLILTIATPAAQSVAGVTSEIPILATPITNHENAGLVKSNENPQTNVTGTSDLPPISKQISLIKTLKPETQNVGILFSLKETNSKYQADIAIKEAEKIGLKSQVFTFSQVAEIQQVIESMCTKVDAIYTPTDNMVASNMELISKTAMEYGIPVICSDVNLISKGAVGTFGVDYFELGKLTAKQAMKILENDAMPQNMPIEYIENAQLRLNHEIIKKLNLKEIES